MNEIDIQLVNKWFEEARSILERSNEICTDSNKQLNVVVHEINQILATNRYQFLIDSISQQLRLLDIICNSLELLIKTFEKEFSDEIALNSVEQLDDALNRLRKVKTTRNKSLLEFINLDDVLTTKSSFLSLKDQIIELKKDLTVKELSDELQKFQNEFSSLLDANAVELITTGLDQPIVENNDLEQDMALLLESLTKHFDQTSKSVEFFKDSKIPSTTKIELYRVLQNDSLELPGVMKEMVELNEKFSVNCEMMNSNIADFKKKEASLIEFFDSLKKYGHSLQSDFIDNFNKRYSEIIDEFVELNGLNDNLLELAKYYRHFIESFDNLKNELKRRQKVNDRLAGLISDFKITANQIQSDDVNAREKFLSENGEYLPRNILDEEENNNILYNMLPVVDIVFAPENIPKI